jgi:hypothetical protein
MRKGLLLVLVVGLVLVAESEGSWFKKAVNTVTDTVSNAVNVRQTKIYYLFFNIFFFNFF